ncbi:hypothetical protein NIES2111_62410 (plasmid) [Nostoc sp. NIES-2111]|nr:hypothetical protein NIES2111_62410 [Nostoc sp. NIES-2111]
MDAAGTRGYDWISLVTFIGVINQQDYGSYSHLLNTHIQP